MVCGLKIRAECTKCGSLDCGSVSTGSPCPSHPLTLPVIVPQQQEVSAGTAGRGEQSSVGHSKLFLGLDLGRGLGNCFL